MLLFCPKGHEQTNLSAMGGLCEVCVKNNPDEFECKREDCPEKSKGQHFHPEDGPGFVDIDGNKW